MRSIVGVNSWLGATHAFHPLNSVMLHIRRLAEVILFVTSVIPLLNAELLNAVSQVSFDREKMYHIRELNPEQPPNNVAVDRVDYYVAPPRYDLIALYDLLCHRCSTFLCKDNGSMRPFGKCGMLTSIIFVVNVFM